MDKKTLFNTIYYKSYPKCLEELGRDPNEDMIVKIIPMYNIIDYSFETQEDFYNVYFQYLADYLNDSVEGAYDFYIELYDLFIETMKEELSVFTDEEIVEYYTLKTILNFYSGFKFERDVNALIDKDKTVYRSSKQRDELDTIYKIDLEILDSDDNLYGIQMKTTSYLNLNNRMQGYHKSAMTKYIKEFGAENCFFLFHNKDVQPMKLKSTGKYLIEYKTISNYTYNDFVVGSYEELQIQLNNIHKK